MGRLRIMRVVAVGASRCSRGESLGCERGRRVEAFVRTVILEAVSVDHVDSQNTVGCVGAIVEGSVRLQTEN